VLSHRRKLLDAIASLGMAVQYDYRKAVASKKEGVRYLV